ncbi:MAG: FMN-binding protein, partial [Clostridia bacterium]|nr:FMN-binding protein [Clostridia bacterium]
KSEVEYYSASKDEEVTAFIFITSAKGYGGDVSVMTAVDLEGEILAVDILDVTGETPGLGQNAAKEGFYSQFAGKNDKITVVKNGADEDAGEINAVTGATISSKAVTSAVNKALEYYEVLKMTSSVFIPNGGDVG